MRILVAARILFTRPILLVLGLFLILSISIRTGSSHNLGLHASAIYNPPLSAFSPPVAVDDSYTVHKFLNAYPNVAPYGVLHNDSPPPPGGYQYVVEKYTPTPHGSVYVSSNGSVSYNPNNGFTGTESVTYTVCNNNSECSNATITFNVVNQPPTAVNDSYTVHRTLQTNLYSSPYGALRNDSDPDGDSFVCEEKYVVTPHGSASISFQGNVTYTPNNGFVGTESITYRVCDSLSACSDGTITFNVVNQPPTAAADLYFIRQSDITRGNGLFDTAFNIPQNGARLNDSDPDGDGIVIHERNYVRTAHGYASVWSDGRVQYSRDPNFVGSDSITYTLCDNLNACSTGTIWFFVLNEGENNGVAASCETVGKPVNVTNGNMYVQQADYKLPGAGGGLETVRTYNSNSDSIGLFGKGWSTAYDESLTIYDNNLLRLNSPDGAAVYFGRAGSGPFNPATPRFNGQITQGAGGYTLTLKDGSSHQFNSAGRLLSYADRNNNQTALTYDANGTLTQVTDPFGRVLTVTTNSQGRVTSLDDSSGTIATYSYSGVGELQTVTYPDNSKFDFTYSAFGSRSLLTTVTDALGHVVEAHAYDGSGRATTSEVDGGVEKYTLSYVGAGQTQVTDALGHVTKYFFDTSKGLNALTRIEGICACSGGTNVQTWTYDNKLNVLTKTDAASQTITFTYDASGNPLTATNVLGTTTFTYNGRGQVLTATDPMQGVTTSTYDANGNLLTIKDALNYTTTFTYDSRGQLLTTKDADNNVTTLTWDTSGRLTEVKDAANNETTYGYDARGRVITSTNALNEATSYEYDAAGRQKKIIHPDTSYLQFTYDPGGRRTKVRDARGSETNFAYDNANRLTSVTNADNKTTSYSYNLMSLLTSQTDALNRTTNYEYDDFNRLVKTIYPPAATGATRLEENLEYNAVGKVKKRIDTAGRATLYDYDTAQRLIKVTDPALKLTQYEYNARSQTTAVVDALNQRYEFTYDPLGHVTQLTRGGLSMSYTYDAVGNRTARTDYNNATTNYAYDDLNRLTTVTYPDSSTSAYAYDELSRLDSATNANGTVSFNYDNRGRLSSTTDVFNQTVGYGYDTNGNRTSLSLGQATNATYQYDSLNRLTQITDSANANVGYVYDATNKLTSRTLPNGVTASYLYDGLDRQTRLTDATTSTTILDAQYQYNTASQVTQIVEPSQTRNFSYDAADRLTTVQNPSQITESYSYDGVGNRTASHISSSYSYQPFNRVISIGSNSYSYDSNGNLTSKTDSSGTWTYTWDYENRLKQVTSPGNTTINYKYDALGRRIQRSKSAGGSTNYIYDGDDVVKDINSDSSTVDYLNGLGVDDKLRQTSASATLYFSQDHLGSTRALTDTSGNVVESVSYDSFGSGASSLTRYGYTGREWDDEAGLYYYRARWYDSQTGRFISEDPIGLAGGVNLYAYVGNSALNFTDPLGLERVYPGESEAAAGLRRQMDGWRQPKYPDTFDWWGTFWGEYNYRQAACIRGIFSEIFYMPSRALADPGVQFALVGIGPLWNITSGFSLAAAPTRAAVTGNRAASVTDAVMLNRMLASEQQIKEVGNIIAGPGSGKPFRDAPRIIAEYGGTVGEWVKKSSSNFRGIFPDMIEFQTHWVENLKTGLRVEHKIVPPWQH